MPIIVDATWPSGQYTAYVTYGDFIDEPNNFTMSTGFSTTSTKLLDVDFINVQETETDELVSLRGRVR